MATSTIWGASTHATLMSTTRIPCDTSGTGNPSYVSGADLLSFIQGGLTGSANSLAGYNGTGNFSGVSIGSGLSLTGGTLSSTAGGGSVTSVSVVSANGFAGTVANATTTPAITLSTSVTGLLKGNGTSIAAAISATDYAPATTGTSILKASSGGFANAVSGTDYAPATTGTSILKASSGGFANAVSGTDYAPATSGSSILYGNGAGGFSNVTVGSGLTFTGGTLAASGASSPLTTKGDLYGFDTANNRVPVGTNGQVLTADSTSALGLKWATPTTGAGTVNSGTAGQFALYSANGTAVSGSGLWTYDTTVASPINGVIHIPGPTTVGPTLAPVTTGADTFIPLNLRSTGSANWNFALGNATNNGTASLVYNGSSTARVIFGTSAVTWGTAWAHTFGGAVTFSSTATMNGSTIHNAGIQNKRTTVADAAYTVLTTDYQVCYTSLTTARAVTLPTTAGTAANPAYYIIKDESGQAGSFNITFAQSIDGATGKSISANYGVMRVYYNGTAFFTW